MKDSFKENEKPQTLQDFAECDVHKGEHENRSLDAEPSKQYRHKDGSQEPEAV